MLERTPAAECAGTLTALKAQVQQAADTLAAGIAKNGLPDQQAMPADDTDPQPAETVHDAVGVHRCAALGGAAMMPVL